MSVGDQNCLLSVLWGNGSSVALRYSQKFKKSVRDSKEKTFQCLVSNDYIKAMRNGNDEWGSNGFKERKKNITLTYAHLSVSPREIAEAEGIKWDSGIAVLVPTNGTDSSLKLYLDEGKKIYDSVARDALCEEIMRDLRESEKGFRKTNTTTTIGAFGSRHTRFSDSDDDVPERQPRRWKLLFQAKPLNGEEEKFIKNVGPSTAMKNIFTFEKESTSYRSVASGNMPLVCERSIGRVPAFDRTLKPAVKRALARQRNLFTCLVKDEADEADEGGKNLFPYMENVFVMDWYSRLERHLFRIKCSGYGKRIGLEFKELELFNMYTEKMEEKMEKMVSFRTPYLEESIAAEKWYERWIKDYRAELSMEAKAGEKYKDIRKEMIHKKYDNIRRSKRRRPPAQWLYENGLIVC